MPHLAVRDEGHARREHRVRCWQLVAARTKILDRVRKDLPAGRPTTAADLHTADLLARCVQEAMRLWPTTPMLLREATCAGVLGDVHGPKLQVLIWNAANHRDAAVVLSPDRFDPDRWSGSSSNWQFNHLSNGRQSCAERASLCSWRQPYSRGGPDVWNWSSAVRYFLPLRPLPEVFDWFAFASYTRPRGST